MKTTARWAAAVLAAIVLGGLCAPGACAATGTQSDEFNAEAVIFSWGALAPEEMRSVLPSIDPNVLSYVAYSMCGEEGDAIFAEVLARKAGLPSTGTQFSDRLEKHIKQLENLPKEQLVALYDLWSHIQRLYAQWEEEQAQKRNATPAPSAAPAPTATPEPVSAEEAERRGDFLMSRIGLDDPYQQEQLRDWFLSFPFTDQCAILGSQDKRDLDSRAKLSEWGEGVYADYCPVSGSGSGSGNADSLTLFGKDWNELTLSGFPAPAQGSLKKTTSVSNARTGRQVVLDNVKEDTFKQWLAQIPQGNGGFAEQADPDAQAFKSNFGSSFDSELADSGGKSVTVYYRQEGADGHTDVRVDYLYTDQTLSVTVLDP